MSTGDWFTLRPFNINNYQPQIDELNNRVSSLETRLSHLQQQVDGIDTQLVDIRDMLMAHSAQIRDLNNQVNQINNNISTLTNTVNQLNNTVNSMSTSINNIVNQYKPIMGFTYNNVTFTDGSGNTATGNFHGGWYQPIKLLSSNISNDGVDLKYLLLVLRGININSITAGRYYNSEPISLPVPFVNNNNYRVFWCSAVSNHVMSTRAASYVLYNVPINSWALSVLLHSGNSLVDDSAFFIVGYI
jgi:chaperonin cofactor prefoldin